MEIYMLETARAELVVMNIPHNRTRTKVCKLGMVYNGEL